MESKAVRTFHHQPPTAEDAMSEKTIACPNCQKKFVDEYALRQHAAARHGGKAPGRGARRNNQRRRDNRKLADIPEVGKEGALAVWSDFTADMPDGAAMAMLDEFGLDVDDLL